MLPEERADIPSLEKDDKYNNMGVIQCRTARQQS